MGVRAAHSLALVAVQPLMRARAVAARCQAISGTAPLIEDLTRLTDEESMLRMARKYLAG